MHSFMGKKSTTESEVKQSFQLTEWSESYMIKSHFSLCLVSYPAVEKGAGDAVETPNKKLFG